MSNPIELYIDPAGGPGTLPTIAAAQERIDAFKKAHDGVVPWAVHICLSAGVHRIEQPLRFTSADSGTRHRPVIYRAAEGAKVTISGGRPIIGWRRASATGLWQATVPDLNGQSWTFSDLYAASDRVPPARLPHTGFYNMAEFTRPDDSRSFKFKPGDIRSFRNLHDVHIVFLKSFDQSRLRIASVDEAESIVKFTGPIMHDLPDGSPHHRRDEGPNARYFLEHVYEGLDAMDRWYLDRPNKVVYYRPANADVDPNQIEIIAPCVEQLVHASGDDEGDRRLEFLSFEDLAFEHCNWTLPQQGYSGCQADLVEPSAISFKQTHFCSMRRCRVAHVGAWAIGLGEGCRDNVIEEVEIEDAGAGGVKTGEDLSEVLHDNASFRRIIPDRPERLHNKRNNILRCHIHHCGRMFYGSIGIFIGDSSDNLISGNRLHDLPYSAVSIGYSWENIPTRTTGNIIERNEVFRCMQVLQDGAGIYCLGRSHGTVIRHNVIYGCRPSHSAGARGIYLDESTTGVLVTCNVVYDTGDGAMLLHSCYDNRIENNIFVEGHESQFYYVLGDHPHNPGRGNVLTRNIFAWSRPEAVMYRMYPIPAAEACTADHNLISAPKPPECAIHLEKLGGPWHEPALRRALADMPWDKHSVLADAGFVDASRGDFRLRADSPAHKIGFVPFEIDLSGLQAYIASRIGARNE